MSAKDKFGAEPVRLGRSSRKNKMRIHFIAIGGAVMHNLAIALHEMGHRVSGSDDLIVDPSRSRLESLGLLPPHEGWDVSRLTPDLEAVILGMHARADNPELVKAQELGLQIYSFPEFLYQQTLSKKRVVIGGSHGKTTITSLVMHVLRKAGRDFDYMVGAQLEGFQTMVHLSRSSDLAVFEGDEYLASAIDRRPKFHLYHPHVAVISGIAWDHINVFPVYSGYVEQFRTFTECITRGGTLIFNHQDDQVCQIAASAPRGIRKVAYGCHPYKVEGNNFCLLTPGGLVPIHLFGKHNMENVSAALAVCRHLGVPDSEFYDAIPSFRGASRRLQIIRQTSSSTAFLDFAHAPSKVRATTSAVRELHPDRRLVACLELHTFSSLSAGFLQQYEGALEDADIAVVYYDPETVRHKKLDPIQPQQVARSFGKKGAHVVTTKQGLVDLLTRLDWQCTDLLLMSSGSFSGLDTRELADRLLRP